MIAGFSYFGILMFFIAALIGIYLSTEMEQEERKDRLIYYSEGLFGTLVLGLIYGLVSGIGG